MGADSNDTTQFWVSLSLFCVVAVLGVAVTAAYVTLRIYNRTMRTTLNVLALAGPGTTVIEIYERISPGKSRVQPSQSKGEHAYGRAVISALGRIAHDTGHFENGKLVSGPGRGRQLDAVPVDSLLASYVALRKTDKSIEEAHNRDLEARLELEDRNRGINIEIS